MVVMFRMSPEKKEKLTKKLDKMVDFIEDFKECLEDSEEYEDEEWEEEPMSRKYRGGMGSSSSMRGRYSRRGRM